MRKVHVKVTIDLTINANDEQEITEVLENMDYSFTASPDSNADIVDTEIEGWVVTDSR